MSNYKMYKERDVFEMRPYVVGEVLDVDIFISDEDIKNGSPKLGDMIAINPSNNQMKWLVSKELFERRYEELV